MTQPRRNGRVGYRRRVRGVVPAAATAMTVSSSVRQRPIASRSAASTLSSSLLRPRAGRLSLPSPSPPAQQHDSHNIAASPNVPGSFGASSATPPVPDVTPLADEHDRGRPPLWGKSDRSSSAALAMGFGRIAGTAGNTRCSLGVAVGRLPHAIEP